MFDGLLLQQSFTIFIKFHGFMCDFLQLFFSVSQTLKMPQSVQNWIVEFFGKISFYVV